MWRSLGAVILLVSYQVATVLACEGYELAVTKLENCDANSVMTLQNPEVKLTEDCKITFSGCIKTTQFSKANLTYNIKINPVPTSPLRFLAKDLDLLKGETDLCAEMKTIPATYVEVLKNLKIPSKCPVQSANICSSDSTTIDIKKYENYKSMFPHIAGIGLTTADINIIHDNGHSCFKLEVEFRKKSGLGRKLKGLFKSKKEKKG